MRKLVHCVRYKTKSEFCNKSKEFYNKKAVIIYILSQIITRKQFRAMKAQELIKKNSPMKFYYLLLITTLLFANNALAQDQGHEMHNMHHAKQDTMPQMMHENQLLNRLGSGTGWLPDAAPHRGYMFHTDEWQFMVHGNVFLTYNKQDVADEGTRGDSFFYSTNWLMGMGSRKIGEKGLFRFNVMLSLEPVTVGGAGYPLLFQSGETWNGNPLVDHQHPHDIISELSVMYIHEFSNTVSAFAYFGYPGEPALGPVAFMHRPSGIVNPNTPIGHHWQDATHVTFGVGTLGFTVNDFKVEGSIFTGTEPDEDRYNFDEPRFNSYSLRLSYNLFENWAFQVSRAWIYDAHSTGPREDLNRTTASVIHTTQLGNDTFLNSTAVWGFNSTINGHHPDSHSFLLESALQMITTTLYGRYEFVEKSTEDLLLDEDIFGHGNLYGVNAITLGLQQKLTKFWNTNLSLGAQATMYITPDGLEEVYGDNPWGLQVYLRLYPGRMMH